MPLKAKRGVTKDQIMDALLSDANETLVKRRNQARAACSTKRAGGPYIKQPTATRNAGKIRPDGGARVGRGINAAGSF
jgi:hypothetical protein